MTDSVSLKDYIRDTLLDITAGIREAQQHSDYGDLIGRAARMEGHAGLSLDGQNNVVTSVAFDVATTVEESTSGKIGGSVKVIALGDFGANGEKGLKNSAISRVTFAVTLAMPRPAAQTQDEADARRRSSEGMARLGASLAGNPQNWMR